MAPETTPTLMASSVQGDVESAARARWAKPPTSMRFSTTPETPTAAAVHWPARDCRTRGREEAPREGPP